MTITEQDYRRVIGEQQLRIVTQADEDIRRGAEEAAQQEMAGYLASRYNTTAIFSAEGEERNPIIVMYLCDIALYHLSAALPQRLGSEVRKERYDRAAPQAARPAHHPHRRGWQHHHTATNHHLYL